jgi:YD repeat-containing protein
VTTPLGGDKPPPTDGYGQIWGYNGNGQVGDGTTTNRTSPVDVSGLTSGVTTISAGQDFTCALTTNGGALCWGDNSAGELWNGTTSGQSQLTPTSVMFTVNLTYSFTDPAYKHALTALSNGSSYQYDADGNMTQRIEGGATYTQTFNAENRLVSVLVQIVHEADQTTQFVYDGGGNLVKQINQDGTRCARDDLYRRLL